MLSPYHAPSGRSPLLPLSKKLPVIHVPPPREGLRSVDNARHYGCMDDKRHLPTPINQHFVQVNAPASRFLRGPLHVIDVPLPRVPVSVLQAARAAGGSRAIACRRRWGGERVAETEGAGAISRFVPPCIGETGEFARGVSMVRVPGIVRVKLAGTD